MKFRQYKFKGKKLLFISGALATKATYENGHESYAHLFGNEIKRYGMVIGKKKDLKFIGWIEANPKLESWFNLLEWPMWI